MKSFILNFIEYHISYSSNLFNDIPANHLMLFSLSSGTAALMKHPMGQSHRAVHYHAIRKTLARDCSPKFQLHHSLGKRVHDHSDGKVF